MIAKATQTHLEARRSRAAQEFQRLKAAADLARAHATNAQCNTGTAPPWPTRELAAVAHACGVRP